MSDVFVARDLRAYFRKWLSGNYYRADLFEMVMMVLTSERAVMYCDISYPQLDSYGIVDLKFDMTDSNVVRVYDLFGMLAVSITRWDANEYNEPLVTGDSDCYWVCFLGEDDSLETFSDKDRYYKRLIELWDYWIWEGARSSALEPFENEFDISQIVADYDLQPYVKACE